MSTEDVVLPCAHCSVAFVPTLHQLGQARRGRLLYCSPECCTASHRARTAAWWRSPAGREYNRARYPRLKAARRRAQRAAQKGRTR